jgi:hypothetical protein
MADEYHEAVWKPLRSHKPTVRQRLAAGWTPTYDDVMDQARDLNYVIQGLRIRTDGFKDVARPIREFIEQLSDEIESFYP